MLNMEYSREKYFAFLAYLLSFIGALYVIFFRPKKEQFALYHAKQSLGIQVMVLGVLAVWFIVMWMLAWIPYIGFIFGIALFALVIAAYIILTISCISGMMYALQGKMQLVPVVGGYATRISSVILTTIHRQ